MNRRSFISDMLKAGVACAFLPGAGRIWKPVYTPVHTLTMEEIPPHTHELLNYQVQYQELLEAWFALIRSRDARLMAQFNGHTFP